MGDIVGRYSVDTFSVPLEKIAGGLIGVIPYRFLSKEDFIQEGWIGILSISYRPEDREDIYLTRCFTAAKRRMVDAIRRFQLLPGRGIRKIEVSTNYYELLLAHLADGFEIESTIDCRRYLQNMTTREKLILQAFSDGHTLESAGVLFGMTEGRMCQIRTKMIKKILGEKG